MADMLIQHGASEHTLLFWATVRPSGQSSKGLKLQGTRFSGLWIMYARMQAAGHVSLCIGMHASMYLHTYAKKAKPSLVRSVQHSTVKYKSVWYGIV